MTVSDPFYSQLSLLLPFDAADGSTTFTDASPFAHSVSTSGSPVISATHSKSGNALYVNGSSSHLAYASHVAFALGAQNFAIGVWVWPEVQVSSYPVLLERSGTWGAGEWQIVCGHVSAPGVYSVWVNSISGSVPILTSTTAPAVGALQHVGLIRTGNQLHLCIDGVVEDTYTISGNFCGATSESLHIGNNFKGWIDAPSITKGSNRSLIGDFNPSTSFYFSELQKYESAMESVSLSESSLVSAARNTVIFEQIDISESTYGSLLAIVIESMGLSSSSSANKIAAKAVVEGLSLAASVATQARLSHVVVETATFAESASGKATVSVSAIDGLKIYEAKLIAGNQDDDLDVWVANIATQAHSRYSGFGFNSFCRYDGKYYGCKSDGVYELTGNTDGADPIPCTVTFAETDFGASNLKRFESVYIGVKASGQLALKVVQDSANVYHYNVIPSGNDGRAARAVLGRGLTGRYWQLELASDTERFELDSIDYSFATLSRRI